MKKLLGITIFSLLLSNISYADNCTYEVALRTFKYSALWEETDGNIPEDIVLKHKELLERTYVFGLSIQQAVKEKDMDKIYSYLQEDMPFQNKTDFKDKSFDEVFTEEQRERILLGTVECYRTLSSRFQIGSGLIWYGNHKDLGTDDETAMAIQVLRGLYQGEE
ncbi:hypothetical protein OAN55_01230 [Candidatus Pelagibacter ubique]|nr:hypothetical protein [Candidatus Pelagibacter ubique]